jgi:hypothetical protein
MIATLRRHIAVFDRRFPQLRTPDGAYMLCCWAASNFCAGVPGARVTYVLGSRRYFPLRNDDYPPMGSLLTRHQETGLS